MYFKIQKLFSFFMQMRLQLKSCRAFYWNIHFAFQKCKKKKKKIKRLFSQLIILLKTTKSLYIWLALPLLLSGFLMNISVNQWRVSYQGTKLITLNFGR